LEQSAIAAEAEDKQGLVFGQKTLEAFGNIAATFPALKEERQAELTVNNFGTHRRFLSRQMPRTVASELRKNIIRT
jgi:hypothetical protein